MVPLHHPAVGLRLAGLNQLTAVVGQVELKAVLRGDGWTDRQTDRQLSILQCLKLLKSSAFSKSAPAFGCAINRNVITI